MLRQFCKNKWSTANHASFAWFSHFNSIVDSSVSRTMVGISMYALGVFICRNEVLGLLKGRHFCIWLFFDGRRDVSPIAPFTLLNPNIISVQIPNPPSLLLEFLTNTNWKVAADAKDADEVQQWVTPTRNVFWLLFVVASFWLLQAPFNINKILTYFRGRFNKISKCSDWV